VLLCDEVDDVGVVSGIVVDGVGGCVVFGVGVGVRIGGVGVCGVYGVVGDGVSVGASGMCDVLGICDGGEDGYRSVSLCGVIVVVLLVLV